MARLVESMRLRQVLIGLSAAVLVVSFALAVFVKPAFAELSIGSGVILIGLLFEARRYLGRVSDLGEQDDVDRGSGPTAP